MMTNNEKNRYGTESEFNEFDKIIFDKIQSAHKIISSINKNFEELNDIVVFLNKNISKSSDPIFHKKYLKISDLSRFTQSSLRFTMSFVNRCKRAYGSNFAVASSFEEKYSKKLLLEKRLITMASKKSRTGAPPTAEVPVTSSKIISGDKNPLIPKSAISKLEMAARKERMQSIRLANSGSQYSSPLSSYNTSSITQADSNFYSPQLSTDFLELPQSEREKRELCRFWYFTDPIVGAAIDFHCFPPGVPVSMVDGSVKSIEDMSVGDEVLNGLGEPTKVLQTFRHDINAPIVRLKVRGVQDIIDCTENHPFLVYRAEKIDCKFPAHGLGSCKQGNRNLCKQKKCSGIDFGDPEFVFAKDLKEGDYICSPSVTDSKSVFSRSQMRLLGYYAAEGSLSRTSYGKLDRVVFTLNSNEMETIAEEISQLLIGCGNIGRKRVRKDSNSCEVRCYKKDFAEFCFNNVGSGSLNKKLSLDIINSSREDILEFLGAYWNGDGTLTKNGYVATTVSKQLAHQIHALALKVGYAPTIHSFKPKASKTGFKSNGTVYRVIIPNRFGSEFSKYANFVQNKYNAKSTRDYNIRVGNNVLRKIEKVETVQYEGPVFNIEVDGEGDRKSYIAYGLATHNTDVPMSKIRLSLPEGSDHERNKEILDFYEDMTDRIDLFKILREATHEYWLHGVAYIFAEDDDLSDQFVEGLVSDITVEDIETNDWRGIRQKSVVRNREPKDQGEAISNLRNYVAENYEGWQRVQILPPEQVKVEVFQYTNKVSMELIPSEKDRLLVMKAQQSEDHEASRIASDIPDEIRDWLLTGQPIPLNTSPYDDFLCSSFCFALSHKKSSYDDRGVSLLERCLRVLLYKDKLRQAQTSIASRAMTPKRVVWVEKGSETDIVDLRAQVEQALIDPDFTVVSNCEVHWDEIGSRDRLLDLSTEYEFQNKLLYIGLRISESMLTGENSYSGERIHLDVMNNMYLQYRDEISRYVEKYLFAPVAEKKGFYEINKNGRKKLLYPKLRFTRLALRDNAELQDFMFNLYVKGSLPISFILELLNIDSMDVDAQLRADSLSMKDATYNEFMKSIYQKAGDMAMENNDNKVEILKRILKSIGIEYKEEEDKRFDDKDL